jgi:signal transduction histidine kinase
MLLANASHELRTPLSRLRLGLELYEQRQDPGVKAELERDIGELDLLIDEILLASRLDAAPALQAETLDLLGLAAEECAHYDECTLTGEPVMIKGDARLLRRLIRNLLDNARRHGTPPVAVMVTRAGAQAVIEVADGGAGIPEAERDKVFTPFHRIGGESKGAGLGLALVRQIARLHGGDTAVVPRPGQPGCCLCVTLPAA